MGGTFCTTHTAAIAGIALTFRSYVTHTAQLPVSGGHDMIGELTIADAILDRIVHNVHRVDLRPPDICDLRKLEAAPGSLKAVKHAPFCWLAARIYGREPFWRVAH